MYDALPPFRVDVKILFGQELPKFQIFSDLVGQIEGGHSAGLVWTGGKIFTAGKIRKGVLGETFRPFQDLFAMRNLAQEHQVIQVRDKIRTGLLALLVARITGRRVIFWMSFPFVEGHAARAREIGLSKGVVTWAANWTRACFSRLALYHFLAKRVDHIFVQSDLMLAQMRAQGISDLRMTAVPMGVDEEWVVRNRPVAVRAVPEFLRGRRVLAYVGTLARSRQPEFLVNVLEEVRKYEPAASLLLIGDAPSNDEKAWLRKMIAGSSAADSIHLTGWVEQSVARDWLSLAELGYSPIPRGKLFDVGSPTKAVEYLAMGIPCIGNDNPDQQLVLEQSGAGVCVPMDVSAFAEATVRFLRDPGLAQRLSENGPPWVGEHRTYPVLAKTVAAVYERLCSPIARPAP